MSSTPVTTAWMRFVKPGSIPPGEKAYELQYVPTDDTPVKNYELHTVSDIPIHDMRPLKHSLSLDKQGFVVAELKTSMQYEDFFDEERLRTVFAEDIRQLVLGVTGGKAAFVHECVIRQRSKAPPSENMGLGQPIPIAHSDYTLDYIQRLVRQLFKDDYYRLQGRRIQMVNGSLTHGDSAWKPLHGPLRDWPLAFCDIDSMKAHEYVPLEAVYESDILESQQVIYGSEQKWYYLSDQTTDEVLIFRAVDSEVEGGVPHGAFQDPRYPNERFGRESIECRILIVH